jgi:hypothetical protein
MAISGILILNSFKTPLFFNAPPSGYSGAPTQNRTCVNCHNDFALNNGGSVTVSGLPVGNYTAGEVYNFSVMIQHAAGASIWGFELKAVISGTGTAIGTFSTTNTHATVVSNEIKHNNAVSFIGTSYTYTNLSWTAPSTGSSNVSFYFTGVAGDADGSEFGDFVYSNSILNIPVIPLTLGSFTGSCENEGIRLNWTTYAEAGTSQFTIERSLDGVDFRSIQTVPAAGNSQRTLQYTFVDRSYPAIGGLLYYRLKMNDLDGKYSYSTVLVVKAPVPSLAMYCYPSPVGKDNKVHIMINIPGVEKGNINWIQYDGSILASEEVNLRNGWNELVRNIPLNAQPGVLIIRVRTARGHYSYRLLVK